jgi:hypothetical protein
MVVTNAGRGLWIDGGAADVNFQGAIVQQSSPSESILIQNATGGTINVNQELSTLATSVASNPIVMPIDYGVFDTSAIVAAPINVSLNANTEVNIGRTQITTPSQRGVAVQNNVASQITFLDLVVTDAVDQAMIVEGNDAASVVAIAGSSSLSSSSTTLAAFTSNDDATLAIELLSLESAVTQGTNQAIVLQGTSGGAFTITDTFTVSGVPGTVAGDVTNTTTGPVTVTVP